MLFWVLVGKDFQIRKAFDYSIVRELSWLFFFILSFHFSFPEYSRKIISAVLKNSGILLIQPKLFFFDWFSSISSQIPDLPFGLQNTIISLPAIFFQNSLCFWLAASYIQPLPTLGWVTWNVPIWPFAAVEYVTVLCHWCNL